MNKVKSILNGHLNIQYNVSLQERGPFLTQIPQNGKDRTEGVP